MPTYQYRCKACENDLEVVQSFNDEPLTECPECQGQLKKVYGNVGISFKGSGFYKTDSRGSGKKKKASADTDSSTKTETKSSDSGGGDKAAAATTSSTSTTKTSSGSD